MRLDRALTLHLFRRFGDKQEGRLPILMYHSISDDPESGVVPYYRTATSPKRFSEQMQWISELGFTGVSLEEALAAPWCGRTDSKLVAITFDDGFHNFRTAAWPVLQRHQFTASMYLPTAFISATRKSCLGRECLTWHEVLDLRKQGVRFGSHTVNHPKLTEVSWSEIGKELIESKNHIDAELGERISSFAYPYSFPQEDESFIRRLTELMIASGYQTCVTTVIGCSKQGDDPFRLKRLPVNECDDRPLLEAKLSGAYDWMGSPQMFVRRAKALMRSDETKEHGRTLWNS